MLTLRHGLSHICGVCRTSLGHHGTNATFFLGSKEYRVDAEKFLRMLNRMSEGRKTDPFEICPACTNDCHDPKDRNYRRRARRFVKKYYGTGVTLQEDDAGEE